MTRIHDSLKSGQRPRSAMQPLVVLAMLTSVSIYPLAQNTDLALPAFLYGPGVLFSVVTGLYFLLRKPGSMTWFKSLAWMIVASLIGFAATYAYLWLSIESMPPGFPDGTPD